MKNDDDDDADAVAAANAAAHKFYYIQIVRYHETKEVHHEAYKYAGRIFCLLDGNRLFYFSAYLLGVLWWEVLARFAFTKKNVVFVLITSSLWSVLNTFGLFHF